MRNDGRFSALNLDDKNHSMCDRKLFASRYYTRCVETMLGATTEMERQGLVWWAFCGHVVYWVRARDALLSQSARRFWCEHEDERWWPAAAMCVYRQVAYKPLLYAWQAALDANCRTRGSLSNAVQSPLFVNWHRLELFAVSSRERIVNISIWHRGVSGWKLIACFTCWRRWCLHNIVVCLEIESNCSAEYFATLQWRRLQWCWLSAFFWQESSINLISPYQIGFEL